jgi:anti-sigma factor RsiW
MRCHEVAEVVEAYALGVLDAGEGELVATHIAQCPDCRQLLAEYEKTLAAVPQALAEVSTLRPPATLRARVLSAAAQSTPPSTNGLSAHGLNDVQPSLRALPAPAPRPEAMAGEVRANWRRLLPRWSTGRVVATLAAGLLLAVLIDHSIQLDVALAKERQLRAEYEVLVSQQEATVLDVVDSPRTIKRQLAQTGNVPAASAPYGKLYTRPDMTQVVAMAARLSPPPPGEEYQLWVTLAGQTQLAGVLGIKDGFGILVFDAGIDGPAYERAVVTLQPAGTTTLTQNVVLRWDQ